MNRSSSSEWSGSAISRPNSSVGSFGLVKRDIMLLAISGILTWIPVKVKMAHALHCNYRVRIVKATIAHRPQLEHFANTVNERRHRLPMDVIGHPNIGINGQTVLGGRFHQRITENLAVRIRGKITSWSLPHRIMCWS